MKKKNQINIRVNKPIHLFGDDLLIIESILVDELEVTKLEIDFDDYECGSFSEIPSDTTAIQRIRIETTGPYVSIEINERSYLIFSSEVDLKINGAVSKIDALLKANLRSYDFNLTRIVAWASYVFGNVAIQLLFYLDDPSRNIKIGLLIVILLSFSLWTFRIFHPVRSKIEFSLKKDRPNFFVRNRDQIYVGLIVGIPVAIVSYLLGVLLSK